MERFYELHEFRSLVVQDRHCKEIEKQILN